jgi:hypothetical protein
VDPVAPATAVELSAKRNLGFRVTAAVPSHDCAGCPGSRRGYVHVDHLGRNRRASRRSGYCLGVLDSDLRSS